MQRDNPEDHIMAAMAALILAALASVVLIQIICKVIN